MPTYDDELDAISLLNAGASFLNTDVDAGVSELCFVDVEVTCDECIVVM